MIEAIAVAAFGAAAVRVGTPLGLAAIGELVAEKSGVINLGIEGAMLGGALAAAVGASAGGPAGGIVAAVLTGTGIAAIFAAIAIGRRADQIITGTAITLGATGATGLVAQHVWGVGGAGLSVPTLAPLNIPGLADIPFIGPAFFRQSALTYACYLLIPMVSAALYHTRSGLRLRASGESPDAARAAGVNVAVVRAAATIFGGACAGLGGASLVLAQVGTFTERMTAGRGFIAIAVVALGRWHPWGAAAAALLFGAATELQYASQAAGSAIPYQLFIAFPYLLALLAFAVSRRGERGPAGLGQPH